MFSFLKSTNSKRAQNIAKSALYLTTQVSLDSVITTRTNIPPNDYPWVAVFGALNTYAIITHARWSNATAGMLGASDYQEIISLLLEEFTRLREAPVYHEFVKVSKMLFAMKEAGGLPDYDKLGLWALEKVGYGCVRAPRQEGDGPLLHAIGHELIDYLANPALAIRDAGDPVDWHKEITK